ncbi:hypothetical protein L6452_38441 [Arctium lappa]|uniref:Uncharacterized protein n=1 Tax=Arctium lappa TaxID=4217 RepID=A0ACB8XPJ3_ARCLA|nr:hypothetical protein L6452_38441 [Arctium lappa]
MVLIHHLLEANMTSLDGQLGFMSTVMRHAVMEESLILDHPFQEFGLPSQVATFSKSIKAMSTRPRRKSDGFLTTTDVGNMDIHVAEINGPVAIGLYDILVLRMNPLKWMGMGIKMSLPSFRVKPTLPARVLLLLDRKHSSESQNTELKESSAKSDAGTSVMLSKPILALEFNCLKIQVEPLVVVSKKHG